MVQKIAPARNLLECRARLIDDDKTLFDTCIRHRTDTENQRGVIATQEDASKDLDRHGEEVELLRLRAGKKVWLFGEFGLIR